MTPALDILVLAGARLEAAMAGWRKAAAMKAAGYHVTGWVAVCGELQAAQDDFARVRRVQRDIVVAEDVASGSVVFVEAE